MDKINFRIREILERFFNGNVSEMARRTQIPQTTLNNIVANKFNKPSADSLEKLLLSIEKINAEWLLTGKGEMLNTEGDVIQQNGGFNNVGKIVGNTSDRSNTTNTTNNNYCKENTPSEQTLTQIAKHLEEYNKLSSSLLEIIKRRDEEITKKNEMIDKLINKITNS